MSPDDVARFDVMVAGGQPAGRNRSVISVTFEDSMGVVGGSNTTSVARAAIESPMYRLMPPCSGKSVDADPDNTSKRWLGCPACGAPLLAIATNGKCPACGTVVESPRPDESGGDVEWTGPKPSTGGRRRRV